MWHLYAGCPGCHSWWPSRGSNERWSHRGFWNGDRRVRGSLFFEPRCALHLLLSASHRSPSRRMVCSFYQDLCSRGRSKLYFFSEQGSCFWGHGQQVPLRGTLPRWAQDTRTARLAQVSEPTVPVAGAGSASPKPPGGALSKHGRVGRCSENHSVRCPSRRAGRSSVLGCSAPAAESRRHGLCLWPVLSSSSGLCST